MKKRNKIMFIGLSMAICALLWSVDQAGAIQPLTPGVDYTKGNYAYSPTTIKKFIDSLPNINAANNLTQQLPRAVPDTITFPGCDYYEIAVGQYREQLHTNLPAVVGSKTSINLGSGGTMLRGYAQEHNGALAGDPHYFGPLILAIKNRPVRIKLSNRMLAGASGNLILPVDTTITGAGMGPLTQAGEPCDPSIGGCASYTQNRVAMHLHGGLSPWISDGTPHQWITPAAEKGNSPFLKGVSQKNVPDMWYDKNTTNIITSCAGQLTCAVANATIDPPGVSTLYWTNQQSGKMMFYHDNALGIARLNVYAGEAAVYFLIDPVQENMLASAGVPGTIPNPMNLANADFAHLIPLIIQDKTFVNAAVAAHTPADPLDTDPLWDTANWGGMGALWFPHVYMPKQDPSSQSGINPQGRWDYGPWLSPAVPASSPYPPLVSAVPEAFLDTPMVNGTAYPYYNVQPAKYRLRILNAGNDRTFNLQMYVADPAGHAIDSTGADVTDGTGFGTEVKMIPAVPRLACDAAGAPAQPDCVCTSTITANCFPAAWAVQLPGKSPEILDGRTGGIPDPSLRGPAMIQIGNDGGLLPAPVILQNTPVGFELSTRNNITVLNVAKKTLMLTPSERADIVVDFTNFAGKTIILYNDSPAPVTAGDSRNDLYTGNPDMSATAGANNLAGPPTTAAGYGPNTRTIMQFRIAGSGGLAPADDYNASPTGVYAKLQDAATGLPAIFKATQDTPAVPESTYNAVGYEGGVNNRYAGYVFGYFAHLHPLRVNSAGNYGTDE